MKVLILGSSGFVGKNLYEYFTNKYDVTAPSHTELDVTDEGSVYNYLKDKSYDVVLNALDGKMDNDYFEKRLRMYTNLSKHSDMYGKMIWFGSGAEYARELTIDNISEEAFGRKVPDDTYGFCLHQMSLDTLRSRNIYNLRLFGIFGKYEIWKTRFISNAICKGIHGLAITVKQDRVMDYLHIDDLCKMTEWMCEHTPRYHDYNATSGRKYKLTQLAEKVNKQLDIKVPVIVCEEGYSKEYTSSNARILSEMKDFEVEDMGVSISKLMEYYKKHKDEIRKVELLY